MMLPEISRACIAAARNKKAESLAFLAWCVDIYSDELQDATDAEWQLLADAARVHPPSPLTRVLVIDRLKTYEKSGVIAA